VGVQNVFGISIEIIKPKDWALEYDKIPNFSKVWALQFWFVSVRVVSVAAWVNKRALYLAFIVPEILTFIRKSGHDQIDSAIQPDQEYTVCQETVYTL